MIYIGLREDHTRVFGESEPWNEDGRWSRVQAGRKERREDFISPPHLLALTSQSPWPGPSNPIYTIHFLILLPSALKMEEICSFKTMAHTQNSAWRNNKKTTIYIHVAMKASNPVSVFNISHA
jgi:hypothetical protein